MKKILQVSIALLFCTALSAQTPFQLTLTSSGNNVHDYPVWINVSPPTGSSYVLAGCTNFGIYTDTTGAPAGSQMVSITYDCNGNMVSDTTLASSGGDTLDIACTASVSCNGCHADFEVGSTSGSLTVNLQDSSTSMNIGTGTQLYIWDMGDGNTYSNYAGGAAPSHTYSTAGNYQICLTTVTYDSVAGIQICQSQSCKSVTVGNPSLNCQFSFTDSVHAGNPSNVTFYKHNISPKPAGSTESYIIDFGDGQSQAFPGYSVTHTYNVSGYTIATLYRFVMNTVGDTICVDTAATGFNISANTNCLPGFSASAAPFSNTVTFTDSSNVSSVPANSVVTYNWDFGDGSSSSATSSTSHTYSSGGYYMVSLTVSVTDTANNVPVCSNTLYQGFLVGNPSSVSCSPVMIDSVHSNQTTVTFQSRTNVSGAYGGQVTYEYDFGDGNSTISSYGGAVHTYSPGIYFPSLSIYVLNSFGDTICTGTSVDSLHIAPPAQTCDADFRWYGNPSGTTISFDDSSHYSTSAIDSLKYNWTFGDGGTSSLQNPQHTYSSAGGTFHVCLDIIAYFTDSTVCTSTHCDSVTVSSVTPFCNTYLTVTPDSLGNPFKFHFDNATGVGGGIAVDSNFTVYNFGDGQSFLQQGSGGITSHTYSAPGIYYACVTNYYMYNGDTSCTSFACDTVVVSPTNVNCHADFAYAVDSINHLGVNFHNQSSSSGVPSNAKVEYTWDYGDGTSGKAFSHTYASPGNYTVCLTATVIDTITQSILCSDSICKNISLATPPFCDASYIVDTANSYFGNVYIWNNSTPAYSDPDYTTNYSWDFGDGDTSNQAFPVHTYTEPGMYGVCLTVSSMDLNQNVCTQTFCDTLGVDSLGNLLYKNSVSGFTLNVLNPETIGLEEASPFDEVQIYPNPVSDAVTISLGDYDGNVDWKINDLKGALVKEGTETHKTGIHVSVEDLRSGLYILTLTNEEFPVTHHKLLIDR